MKSVALSKGDEFIDGTFNIGHQFRNPANSVKVREPFKAGSIRNLTSQIDFVSRSNASLKSVSKYLELGSIVSKTMDNRTSVEDSFET